MPQAHFVVMECQVACVVIFKMKGAGQVAKEKQSVESCMRKLIKLPSVGGDELLDALGYKGRRDNAALIAAVMLEKAKSGDINCLREVMRMCSQEVDTVVGVKIVDDVK